MSLLIRRYPFLSWAAVSLLLLLLVRALEALGGGYDDRALGSLSFALGLVWAWIAFPYYLTSEYLIIANNGQARTSHWFVTLLVGSSILIAAELLNQTFRRVRGRRNAV